MVVLRRDKSRWLMFSLAPGACLQCEVCDGPGTSCSGDLQTCLDGQDSCGVALTEMTWGRHLRMGSARASTPRRQPPKPANRKCRGEGCGLSPTQSSAPKCGRHRGTRVYLGSTAGNPSLGIRGLDRVSPSLQMTAVEEGLPGDPSGWELSWTLRETSSNPHSARIGLGSSAQISPLLRSCLAPWIWVGFSVSPVEAAPRCMK
uniref:Uncharacterized protein n=1 Tax=Terrapene triunguis TaxID=2587831 RepID=A0A674JUD4_9SAUR